MNRKYFCPECKGDLKRIRKYQIIQMDMPVIISRFQCVKCKIIWDYNRFFGEYKLIDDPIKRFVERRFKERKNEK